jgi:hypothetical protein
MRRHSPTCPTATRPCQVRSAHQHSCHYPCMHTHPYLPLPPIISPLRHGCVPVLAAPITCDAMHVHPVKGTAQQGYDSAHNGVHVRAPHHSKQRSAGRGSRTAHCTSTSASVPTNQPAHSCTLMYPRLNAPKTQQVTCATCWTSPRRTASCCLPPMCHSHHPTDMSAITLAQSWALYRAAYYGGIDVPQALMFVFNCKASPHPHCHGPAACHHGPAPMPCTHALACMSSVKHSQQGMRHLASPAPPCAINTHAALTLACVRACQCMCMAACVRMCMRVCL